MDLKEVFVFINSLTDTNELQEIIDAAQEQIDKIEDEESDDE